MAIPPINPEAVRAELRRVAASSGFNGSPRLSEFLAYIVEEQLAGRGHAIKEYVIGVEVYHKPRDYDPRVDAAVRVDAGKLRARLERYYEGEGINDAIRISVPKGGYIPCFEAGLPVQDNDMPAPQARRRSRWLIIGLAAVCVLLAAAGLVRFHTHALPRMDVRTWPLTGYTGEQYDPALSPDGGMLAFSWNGESRNNFDIYVKAIHGPQATRLTTDPARDSAPAWSPDGQQIAFLRASDAGSIAMVIPALGGAERTVAPAEGWSITWTKDSRFLVVARRPASEHPYAGFLTSVETGEQRQITFPPADSEVGDYDFTVSPDGRRLAFSRMRRPPYAEICVSELDGGKVSTLRSEVFLGGLAWVPDGNELIFSSRASGIASLWRLNVADGSVATVGPTALDATRPSVATRPVAVDRVAYQRSQRPVNLFLRTALNASPPRRVAESMRESVGPQFSPDGRRIAFASNRTGFWNIWTCRPDGTELRNITPSDWLAAGAPRWSPDGTKIAFDAHREKVQDGSHDVFLVNADGAGLPQQLTHSQADCVRPSWSADGGSIYFSSNSTGTRQIWKELVTGGGAVQVTHGGGFDSYESYDGRELFFTKGVDIPGIWRISTADGQEEFLLPDVLQTRWGLTHKGLMFADRSFRLCRLALDSGITTCGSTMERVNERWGIAFSPDGEEMVYSNAEPVNSELFVLEGQLFH